MNCENKMEDANAVIQEYYVQYKKFIARSDMPEIRVHVQQTDNKTIFASMLCNDGKYTLSIPAQSLEVKEPCLKSGLFHEFTHTLDDFVYSSIGNQKDRDILLKTYTEYHATMVELMAAAGFKNEKEAGVRLGEMHEINGPYLIAGLKDYLESHTESARKKVKMCIAQGNITTIFLESWYYAGRASFANEYADFDLSDLIDLSIFSDPLGEGFLNAVELISNGPSTKEHFQELFELQHNMIEHAYYFRYK